MATKESHPQQHLENTLRREALGRRNWLFVGNGEGGEVNATLVTLLASCQMHNIEPISYLAICSV